MGWTFYGYYQYFIGAHCVFLVSVGESNSTFSNRRDDLWELSRKFPGLYLEEFSRVVLGIVFGAFFWVNNQAGGRNHCLPRYFSVVLTTKNIVLTVFLAHFFFSGMRKQAIEHWEGWRAIN